MPRRVVSERAVLSRERIVGAAVALIERQGPDGLSMRQLAAELDVGVMSLYNHVPNKAALIDEVAGHVLAGLDRVDDPKADYQDRARALARAFRAAALAHPRCMEMILTRRAASPAEFRLVEQALDIAYAAGFTDASALRAVRAFLAYAMGSALRETGPAALLAYRPGDPGLPHEADWFHADAFPRLTAVCGAITHPDPDHDFEFGLDLLIAAVENLRRQWSGAQNAAQ